ncbi:MAG: class I SAM-dependent methyltransferase [Theionarchaea archaeon]|nr:class I SAM-dependent methyltransferase [Theionarchaea archaeon]MBU7037894.1 class I SAM-dependent methyltransferase [Theionarchaea archaeon]
MKTSFWEREALYDPDHQKPIRLVRNVVAEMRKRGMSDVLEVGCGKGRNCLYLARKGLNVTGVDSDCRTLLSFQELLREEGLSAAVACADISALPFIGECFDLIMFIHVLTFTRECARWKTLDEAKRVLKRGGILVLVERSQGDPLYQEGVQIERDTYRCQGITHHFFSKEELDSLLSPLKIAIMRESRTIDTSHGSPHVHGMWFCVAIDEPQTSCMKDSLMDISHQW